MNDKEKKMSEINRFNIRIYGIFIDGDKVLVTDEFRLGTLMTKFPGGGLKFGEGTIDCLKREFREELQTDITILSHFYTTDFYQPTELLPATFQLISIYYLVKVEKPFSFTTTQKKFDFPEIAEGAQNFRWIDLKTLNETDFTLPIDKVVGGMLMSRFSHQT
ncbi:MAG: NUDIX domain-containing protein [Bacteroidetes bacterium]|nr:NUDIX domain-containing protein [Bacteroidota bacterium]